MPKHYDDTCSLWCLRLDITTIVFCRWGWPGRHYNDNIFLQDYMAKHNNLYDDTSSLWCLRLAITMIVFCRWGWSDRHYDDNIFYRTIWRNIAIFTITHVHVDVWDWPLPLYFSLDGYDQLEMTVTIMYIGLYGWRNITITPVPLDITMFCILSFYIIR